MAIRQKILSHSSPGVIKHYMQSLVTVDTQSLFLGKQSCAKLMEASIRMGRVRDPRALVKLSSEENKVAESDHPQLSILDAEQEEVKRKILVLYRTIENTKGTSLGKHYRKLSEKINNLRQKCETNITGNTITQKSQINLTIERLPTKTISTTIPDFKLVPRTRIARYFLGHMEFDIPQVIADLVELCRNWVTVPFQHMEDSILDRPMTKPEGRPLNYTPSDGVMTPPPTASNEHASRSAGRICPFCLKDLKSNSNRPQVSIAPTRNVQYLWKMSTTLRTISPRSTVLGYSNKGGPSKSTLKTD
ncbi:unnamed protein product [Tuber aestivum]|uniref:Uncharacterized protein n=1 Tax=Tuber aestivum TaxID=59557 RepID=A0A292Q3Q4_9PEZI|nr:unnamed protein product [Tuber aestivum]